MDALKKTGIIIGAVAGGIVGGGISLIGKLSKKKIVDDLGSDIVSSSILMGGLVGEVASGTTDIVSGKVTKNAEKVQEGVDDIKGVGKQFVDNVVENVSYVVDTSGEIATGIKEKDKSRVSRGAKKLAKWITVGAITVGIVKIAKTEDDNPKDILPEEISDTQKISANEDD